MNLEEKLKNGKFVITSEIGPPKGTNILPHIEEAEKLRSRIDAFNVTDIQSSVMRLGSLAVCRLLFEKGIERILQHASDTIEVVFMVNIIDYFSDEKPTLYIYLTNYQTDKPNHKDIEKAFQDFYNSCLGTQQKRATE